MCAAKFLQKHWRDSASSVIVCGLASALSEDSGQRIFPLILIFGSSIAGTRSFELTKSVLVQTISQQKGVSYEQKEIRSFRCQYSILRAIS